MNYCLTWSAFCPFIIVGDSSKLQKVGISVVVVVVVLVVLVVVEDVEDVDVVEVVVVGSGGGSHPSDMQVNKQDNTDGKNSSERITS